MFPIAPDFISYILALSSTLVTTLYKQPAKGGDYNIALLGLSKAWLTFFCAWPIKHAHHKGKKEWTLGCLQVINNTSHKIYYHMYYHGHIYTQYDEGYLEESQVEGCKYFPFIKTCSNFFSVIWGQNLSRSL
jgi:hypothetical protein